MCHQDEHTNSMHESEGGSHTSSGLPAPVPGLVQCRQMIPGDEGSLKAASSLVYCKQIRTNLRYTVGPHLNARMQ